MGRAGPLGTVHTHPGTHRAPPCTPLTGVRRTHACRAQRVTCKAAAPVAPACGPQFTTHRPAAPDTRSGPQPLHTQHRALPPTASGLPGARRWAQRPLGAPGLWGAWRGKWEPEPCPEPPARPQRPLLQHEVAEPGPEGHPWPELSEPPAVHTRCHPPTPPCRDASVPGGEGDSPRGAGPSLSCHGDTEPVSLLMEGRNTVVPGS